MRPAVMIWRNGRQMLWEEASDAPAYDAVVTESVRAFRTARGTEMFRLRERAARFAQGLPYGADEIAEACRQVVRVNSLESAYVLMFAGRTRDAWDVAVVAVGTDGERAAAEAFDEPGEVVDLWPSPHPAEGVA